MGSTIRLASVPPAWKLPPLTGHFPASFRDNHFWPALLPRGARVYRYGASERQVKTSAQPWVNLTEDCFQFSGDALQFCSLLDMTVADHGERDRITGQPIGAVSEKQAWNTAALRGELEATADVYAWAGLAASMAFDRVRGAQATGAPGQDVHFITPGGASQLLIRNADMAYLRLVAAPMVLPRVRVWQ